LQPLGVVGQIVLGGVTVLVDLHPAAVAAHFLLSMAIIAAAVALHVRAGEAVEGARPAAAPPRAAVTWLGRALVAVTGLVLVLGTVVTGTGPHAGDPKSPRFGYSIAQVAQMHAGLVWIAIGLTFAIGITLRVTGGPARLRTASRHVLFAELAQGGIGYLQYATGDPAFIVGVHILGACFVWVGVLRLAHALRPA
jgi:cytochrome c oxidase assembly protein subunit 15